MPLKGPWFLPSPYKRPLVCLWNHRVSRLISTERRACEAEREPFSFSVSSHRAVLLHRARWSLSRTPFRICMSRADRSLAGDRSGSGAKGASQASLWRRGLPPRHCGVFARDRCAEMTRRSNAARFWRHSALSRMRRVCFSRGEWITTGEEKWGTAVTQTAAIVPPT